MPKILRIFFWLSLEALFLTTQAHTAIPGVPDGQGRALFPVVRRGHPEPLEGTQVAQPGKMKIGKARNR